MAYKPRKQATAVVAAFGGLASRWRTKARRVLECQGACVQPHRALAHPAVACVGPATCNRGAGGLKPCGNDGAWLRWPRKMLEERPTKVRVLEFAARVEES